MFLKPFSYSIIKYSQHDAVRNKPTTKNYSIKQFTFSENNIRKNFTCFMRRIEYLNNSLRREKDYIFFPNMIFLGALMDDSPHQLLHGNNKFNSFNSSQDNFKELMKSKKKLRCNTLQYWKSNFKKMRRPISCYNVAAQYQSGKTRTEHDLIAT